MTTKYVQRGECIDYTPGADVAVNAVVQLGILLGVATTNIAANTVGALGITGVWSLPKKAGAAITVGAKLTWSVADGAFIVGAGVAGDTLGGAVAATAAASADTTVQVLFCPGTGSVVA